MNADFLPLADLVDQIAALCAGGQSGTVLLVSDDNRMAQLHLHQGQIVFVLCRGRRGRDGLEHLRGMRSARMRLDPVTARNTDAAPLPTGAILDYLKGDLAQLPELQPSAASAPAAPPAAADFLTPQVRVVLRQTLARYIGPMADIICGEHFDTQSDLRALAMSLSGEIPAREQALRFQREVADALGLAPL